MRGGSALVTVLDPRARVVVAFGLSAVVVFAGGLLVPAVGLGLACAAVWLARLDRRATVRRVLTVDLFILVMVLMLPFTTPGQVVFNVGPLAASAEGLRHAAAIALKANAVVLFSLAFMSTMEAVTLGHALARLGLPARLVEVLLFTVRYLEVIGREYKRLRAAMKARAFRPRSNLHTWRSFGYLVGMLLVRSLDRARRILAAMKCRGYTGTLHLIDAMRLQRADGFFLGLAGATAAGLVVLDLVGA